MFKSKYEKKAYTKNYKINYYNLHSKTLVIKFKELNLTINQTKTYEILQK